MNAALNRRGYIPAFINSGINLLSWLELSRKIIVLIYLRCPNTNLSGRIGRALLFDSIDTLIERVLKSLILHSDFMRFKMNFVVVFMKKGVIPSFKCFIFNVFLLDFFN